MKKFNIAVIPGDGIGKEVMPEAIKILELIKTKFNLSFESQRIRLGMSSLQDKRLLDAS